jgi:hypothetical protein
VSAKSVSIETWLTIVNAARAVIFSVVDAPIGLSEKFGATPEEKTS